MFSRFLTRAEFDQISSLSAVSNPCSQFIQWRSLEIGAVYRVIKRITIPTAKRQKNYVVLETEQQQIINYQPRIHLNKGLVINYQSDRPEGIFVISECVP